MEDILYRGFHKDEEGKDIIVMNTTLVRGYWVYGLPIKHGFGSPINKIRVFPNNNDEYDDIPIVPETLSTYTQLNDKNGTRVFVNDIVQYNTYDDFDCQSVVSIGLYEQDGSSGEYSTRNCYGTFVKVNNFTCPDWCDDEGSQAFTNHNEYLLTQNLNEVIKYCEVIGNIFSSPDLLK